MDTDCSICYDTEDAEIFTSLQCGHFYHSVCIKQWLDKHNTCPCCRQIINDETFSIKESIMYYHEKIGSWVTKNEPFGINESTMYYYEKIRSLLLLVTFFYFMCSGLHLVNIIVFNAYVETMNNVNLLKNDMENSFKCFL